jgi:molybdopterin-guanine dinucleotide biosynthesis protein A
MVAIGATGRNVGKTEFACELIRRLAPRRDAVGVKITTIREQGGACPRGGDGCGVCGSLKGEYLVTEETDTTSGKDTARMLKAGANRVLWLRVRHASLEEGVRALMGLLPEDTPIVCESNSVRKVANPGYFVIIHDKRLEAIKESCREVMSRADRQIAFDGTGWDAQPADLTFDRGRWWWRMDAAAIVLAGGRSRRMGQDKSMLPFGAKPLLVHIADQLRPHFRFLLVGANDPARYGIAGAPVVPDRAPGQGPLMGLSSCLEATSSDKVFLTGCDIPAMDIPTIRSMMAQLDGFDAVIPVTEDGMRHPLFAAYRRSVLPVALAALSEGKRRMEDMLERVRAQTFPIRDNRWFRNLNTPEEYVEACATAAAMQGGGK